MSPGNCFCVQLAIDGALVYGLRMSVCIKGAKLHSGFAQRIDMFQREGKNVERMWEILPFLKPESPPPSTRDDASSFHSVEQASEENTENTAEEHN